VDRKLGAISLDDRSDLEEVSVSSWAEVEPDVVLLVVDRDCVFDCVSDVLVSDPVLPCRRVYLHQ
jgi:hypothetical protein